MIHGEEAIMLMSKEEKIKLEHTTLLEEYRSVKADISFNVSTTRQIVNLTLTAGGALVASAPFIIQYQIPILFLIAPLIFYALAWSQMRCILADYHLINYLTNVLVPKIRRVLAEISPEPQDDFHYNTIMSWESYYNERRYSLFTLPIAPSASSSYSINLLIAFFSAAAYIILNYPNLQNASFVDIMLIIANVSAFLYSIILGVWSRFFLDKESKKNTKKRH
jgi:hypothetical protein